jgi:2,3-bisphosphoglycerate-independent phosphoglycerate mutase
MPVLMIIGDGMSDLPLPELGGQTPLEIASCSNMARLASQGSSGLLDPLGPGLIAESEAAIMTILGYSNLSTKIARGPLEALGASLFIGDDDLAFRCNFSLVDEDLRVLKERVDASDANRSEFTESLRAYCSDSWGVDLSLKVTWRFKGVMTLRGEKLSPNVTTPPPKRGERASRACALEETTAAKRTVAIINSITEQSNKILSRDLGPTTSNKRQANIMIPWGAGRRSSPESFYSRFGLRAACVAGAPLTRGIGRLCGMTVPTVAGATGGIDTNIEAKTKSAIEACKDHDFVLLHLGGPDEASHDGEIASKILIIKKIDLMLGDLLDTLPLDNTLVLLMADHTSSIALRRHTHHPTPITIAGSQIEPDNVKEYSESAAVRGKLGRILGSQIMDMVIEQRRKAA